MNRVDLYAKLSESIGKEEDVESEEPVQSINSSEIWECLFNIAETTPYIVPQFIPLLIRYSFTQESDTITKQVNHLKEITSQEEKEKQLLKLLLFLTFIDLDNAATIFEELVKYIDTEFQKSPAIPAFLLNFANKYHVEVDTPIHNVFLEKMTNSVGTPQSAATTAAFALFVATTDVIPIDNKEPIIKQHVLKLLEGSVIEQIAACFVCYCNPSAISTDKKLLQSLLKLSYSTDNNILVAAHKSLREIIDDEDSSLDDRFIHQVIATFKNYDKNSISFFFKLVQRFLSAGASTPLAVVSPIYEFAIQHIQDPSPKIAAESIDLLSSIGHVNADFVSEAADVVVSQAQRLLTSDFAGSAACRIAGFFAVSKSGAKFVPVLHAIFNSTKHTMTRKERLELATALATIGSQNNESIVEFVKKSLSDFEGSEIFYVLDATIEILPRLTEETACELFSQLLNILEQQEENVKANAVADVLKKIAKRFTIKNELIEKTFADILDAKLPVFGGLPLHAFTDSNTVLFHLVAKLAAKFPESAKKLCVPEKAASVMTTISFELVASVLEVVETCVSNNIVEADFGEKFGQAILELAETLSLKDEYGAMAVFKVIRACLENEKHLKRAKAYDSLLSSLLMLSETDCSQTSQFVKLMALVISLLDGEFPAELTKIVAACIPTPETSDNQTLIESIVEASKHGISIPQEILASLSALSILKKSEITQMGIADKTFNEFKQIIADAIKNKETLTFIQKSFGNSRAKVNKFNTTFKVK